jgi:hypothetical protein
VKVSAFGHQVVAGLVLVGSFYGMPVQANDGAHAVLGALVGAGSGAALGHAMGGRDGALIGSALGAVVGTAAASRPVYSAQTVHYGYNPGRVWHTAPPVYMPPPVYAPPPVYGVAPVVVYRSRDFCDHHPRYQPSYHPHAVYRSAPPWHRDGYGAPGWQRW